MRNQKNPSLTSPQKRPRSARRDKATFTTATAPNQRIPSVLPPTTNATIGHTCCEHDCPHKTPKSLANEVLAGQTARLRLDLFAPQRRRGSTIPCAGLLTTVSLCVVTTPCCRAQCPSAREIFWRSRLAIENGRAATTAPSSALPDDWTARAHSRSFEPRLAVS
ncbi:hypothetical protein CDD83_5369 [Cordyceps sp. RAO-2017]|nr:hypothetical protein CDD83_5369 [Cordyceps sp. RAO-2017]